MTSAAADALLSSLNPAQRDAVSHGPGRHPAPPLRDHRRRRLRQDQHACASRRPAGARWLRSAAHPAADVLPARRAELERRAGQALLKATRAANAARAVDALGRNVPQRRRAAAARVRRAHRARAGHSRSTIAATREDLMGLVRQGLPRRHVPDRASPRRDLRLDLQPRRQRAGRARRTCCATCSRGAQRCEAELRALFDAYVAAKQAQHVLDFDDLLLYWAAMMDEHATRRGGRRAVRPRAGRRVPGHEPAAGPHPARASSRTGAGVTVVGDDAQAIYGFRAATVRNILDFPAQYDPPARIVTLERNYRSTQPILDASQRGDRARGANGSRRTCAAERAAGERPLLVSVRDEADQARCVAERVLAHRERAIALKAPGGAVSRRRATARRSSSSSPGATFRS